MNLKKRLNKIADCINKDDVIADIGTDHAFLPIYAIQNKGAKFAYAIDINQKPLESAKQNIKFYGVEEKIQTILSNGLNFISKEIYKIDKCCISGLGTNTIIEILNNDSKKINEYLICSNTEISQLRKWTYKKHFTIIEEDFFIDQDKRYWFIRISKKKSLKLNFCIKKENKYFGDKKFYLSNIEYQQFIEEMIDKNIQIIEKINDHKKKKDLLKKNKIMEGTLKRWDY